MDTPQVLWLYTSIALVVGLAIGLAIGRQMSGERRQQQSLQTHLEDLQQKQQAYQSEVNQHFTKTADLLSHLAESYKEVHNHLAQGAEQLCAQGEAPLQRFSEQEPRSESGKQQELRQPLDYAPRAGGQLDEDFGLEKVARETAPTPPSAI